MSNPQRIRQLTTQEIIRAGHELIKAKDTVECGTYLAWARDNLGIKPNAAWRFMSVAERLSAYPGVECLPPSVAYRLASPKVPASQIEAAIAMYSSGSTLKEADVVRSLVRHFRSRNIAVETEVDCGIGRADVVTPDTVIEVEGPLNRHALFCAVGQVLLYRQSIDPARKAVIVGLPHCVGEGRAMYATARALGVEVWEWDCVKNATLEKLDEFLEACREALA